jgi:hypothetical protein
VFLVLRRSATHLFFKVGFKPTTRIFLYSPAPCSLLPTPSFICKMIWDYVKHLGNTVIDYEI